MQWPFVLFAAWFALNALSLLWAPDVSRGAHQLERYLSFVLLLPVGLWGVNGHYDWHRTCRILVWGSLMSVFVYLFATYWGFNYECLRDIKRPYEAVDPPFIVYAPYISCMKHRLYYSTVLLLSVVATCYLHPSRVEERGRLVAWIQTIGSSLIFVAMVWLTDSRANLLTAFALLAVAVLIHLPRRYRWWIGGIVAIVCLTGALLVLRMNPRMQDFRINQLTERNDGQYDVSIEPRLNIWRIALSTPADYSAHGLGAAQSVPYLVERYEAAGLTRYTIRQYNTHNQYLNEWMELGIPGLVLFLLAWLSLPFCTSGTARRTSVYIGVIFGLNMLTECMFGRFDGIAIWVFCLIWLLLQSTRPDSKTE